MHVALHGNISAPVWDTDLVEMSKDAASLLVCTRKNIFCLGDVVFFCEWLHKWRTFKPPWSTLPGLGCQPLGRGISLMFLLETRLQSESFDQGCGSCYFVNPYRFHTYRFHFQQNLDSNRAWALSHLWSCWQAWLSKPVAYDLQGHTTC